MNTWPTLRYICADVQSTVRLRTGIDPFTADKMVPEFSDLDFELSDMHVLAALQHLRLGRDMTAACC